MTPLTLTATQWHIIDTIVADYRGHLWVFGSRATGQARRYSDLDLCLKLPNDNNQTAIMANLNAQFDDSSLPFKVDLLNYMQLDSTFKAHIDQQAVTWTNTTYNPNYKA